MTLLLQGLNALLQLAPLEFNLRQLLSQVFYVQVVIILCKFDLEVLLSQTFVLLLDLIYKIAFLCTTVLSSSTQLVL